MARRSKRGRAKQIEDMREQLIEGLIAPQEVLANDDLSVDDKISLLLSRDVMTDVGFHLLTLNLVNCLRRDFGTKAHDFGLHMSAVMKSSLDKMEAYAHGEIKSRELAEFLKKYKINSAIIGDIEPSDIAMTCISLYHFAAGDNAANDMSLCDNTDVDPLVYVEATADYTLSIILDAIQLTYRQMLN